MKYNLILCTKDYTPPVETLQSFTKNTFYSPVSIREFINKINVVNESRDARNWHVHINAQVVKQLRNMCFIVVQILRTYSITNVPGMEFFYWLIQLTKTSTYHAISMDQRRCPEHSAHVVHKFYVSEYTPVV
jgi:hypothetical protein